MSAQALRSRRPAPPPRRGWRQAEARLTYAAGQLVRRARAGRRPAYAVAVIMLLLLISGLATGFSLAVRLNYALGIVMVVSYIWAKWGTGTLTAQVERPRGDLSVGDELHEVISVRNAGGPPRAWIEVEDVTDIPDVNLGRVISLPGIVTFRRVEPRVRLTRRGVYTLGPLVIRSADPFGIFPQEKVLSEARPIKVFPRTVEIPDFVMPSTELSGEHARRRRSPLLSPEVASVREYQPGDSISRIHWPTTARTGQLMVKLFDRGRAGEVWVIFDQEAKWQAGEGAESTDEYGATIAASTAQRYLSAQLPVGYIAHGSRSLVLVPERGSGQREVIFDHLAASRPTGSAPLFQALVDVERELGRNSSLVVVTASPDPAWADALTNLQKRGVRANVVLLDAPTFGAAWSMDEIRMRLLTGGARTFLMKRGGSIASALAEPEAATLRSSNGRKAAPVVRR